MIKVTLELADEQLLDVVVFVKSKDITAVFEGALLLEVGKKYRNRKGKVVHIEGEEYGMFRGGRHLYYPNGRFHLYFENELDLIEEVKEELPFDMVVGGLYEMRNGKIEEIVGNNEHPIYPFIGKSGRCYTKEGLFVKGGKCGVDLIKRIR